MDWTKEEVGFLKTMSDHDKIQAFLDSIDYNPKPECSSRKWVTTEDDLEFIGDKLESMRHFPVVNDTMIKGIYRASDISLRAGMPGSNEDGLFKPS